MFERGVGGEWESRDGGAWGGGAREWRGRAVFARYRPARVIDFLDGFDLEKQ